MKMIENDEILRVDLQITTLIIPKYTDVIGHNAECRSKSKDRHLRRSL